MTKYHLTPLFTALCLCVSATAMAEEISVSTTEEFRAAVGGANPGDVILMQAGTYRLDAKLNLNRAGESNAPITIRAASDQAPLIESNTVEALNISAPHWTLENLHFVGVCQNHSSCEHALHIVRAADHTTVRGCTFQNFNAQIKGNGEPGGENGAYIYPDDVLIEGSEFFNDTVRETSNPVTPIDIVGGRRWVVRANFIHDHAKGQGNNISYAAFFKGNSRDGIFERNLIACELLHSGQIRLGLSLGGGGTGPDSICEDGTCNPEHQGGILRNNIIVNCPTDVGIYLNEATNTRIEHNTLFNTTGIDARFDTTDVILVNNVLDGKIRERNGGTITASQNNLEQIPSNQLTSWFTAPGMLDFSLAAMGQGMLVDQANTMATSVMDDFCGNQRQPPFDIGAIEYTTDAPCDTTMPHPTTAPDPMMGEDMGMATEDMGSNPTEDMGGAMDEDMGTNMVADMNAMPGEDMGSGDPPTSDMGGGMEQAPDMNTAPDPMNHSSDNNEEDGCQSVASNKPATPSLALMMLFVIGLIGRRRSSPRA